MQFSIRDVLLVMLVAGCAAGWWRDHADGVAEIAKLAKDLKGAKRGRGYGSSLYMKLYEAQVALGNAEKSLLNKEKSLLETEKAIVEEENARLEEENARLQRRLLDHSTQLNFLLDEFTRKAPDS